VLLGNSSRKLGFVNSISRKELKMTAQGKALHIDIPVKLTEVKVAFSIASLSFEGDLPACLFHLQLIVNDISDWKAKSQVVAVFHTNAGQVTLHDQAYNPDRNGNPYKKLGYRPDGARCASRTLWRYSKGPRLGKCGNADLIPGIKINTDAIARTTQLVQEGFVKISES